MTIVLNQNNNQNYNRIPPDNRQAKDDAGLSRRGGCPWRESASRWRERDRSTRWRLRIGGRRGCHICIGRRPHRSTPRNRGQSRGG